MRTLMLFGRNEAAIGYLRGLLLSDAAVVNRQSMKVTWPDGSELILGRAYHVQDLLKYQGDWFDAVVFHETVPHQVQSEARHIARANIVRPR